MTSLPAKQTLDRLPPLPAPVKQSEIHQALRTRTDAVIVLDDDPTGTQTVYDIPVLTEWSVDTIVAELRRGTLLFFILTNSRSLTASEARQLAIKIGKNIAEAGSICRKSCLVISRSDSTLRGHYPAEVKALEQGLGQTNGVHILIPAFFEGGRYTINDIHYVKQMDQLLPAADTPYAADHYFGYHHSNLRAWVEEKTEGAVPADKVLSFSIADLRTEHPTVLAQRLDRCTPGTVCVVNAADYRDLEIFCLAVLQSAIFPVFRTAASFVAALAAQPKQALLGKEIVLGEEGTGGLLIIGSYVPTTTVQIEQLAKRTTTHMIELEVDILLDASDSRPLLDNYIQEIDDYLSKGQEVAVYTSRALITTPDEVTNVAIGQRVSDFLTTIVQGLKARPKYLIAKGGITSSDTATVGLGVKRSRILGQILPGVPVWKLGPESKYPGLPYIVFPGNVGEETALAEVVSALRE